MDKQPHNRETMLERIRKALAGSSKGPAEPPSGSQPAPLLGVMPPIPTQELIPKFEAELTKVGGNIYRAATRDELAGIIRNILQSAQATSAVLTRNPILEQLGIEEHLRARGISVVVWPSATAPGGENDESAGRNFAAAGFAAAVGFSGVEFVLAETGSLVLTSRTEGSQLASLAPPVHIALYRRSQVVGSLDEVLEKLPIALDPNKPAAAGLPSPGRSVVFITGPSRTADIEQILVRGVHGPREVHAILVEESCLA